MKYKVLAPILPGIGSKVIEAGEIVTGEQVPDADHFLKIGAIEVIEVKKQVEQKKVKTERTTPKRRTTRKKSGEE